MFSLNLVAAAAIGVQMAFAASVAPFQPLPVMYLVNCLDIDPEVPPNSNMIFYKNGTGASDPNNFGDDSTELTQNGWIKWEGATVNGYFSSGNSFSAKINANAQNQSAYALVGTGSGYGSTKWSCYKDKGEVLGSGGENTCDSIYYCYRH